ncbi:hypothetical protein [Sinobaca sp. H24]|nr:hypothetical protein [Sinobaca sp. H24]
MWVERLKKTVAGQTEMTNDDAAVERLSKDAYWYSQSYIKN